MDMTMRRAAFVTGASDGAGAATALALGRDGFDVAVSATSLANLTATIEKLNAAKIRAVPIVLDLCSEPSIMNAVSQLVSEFPYLDVLVNNAGADVRKLAVDVTRADWDRVIGT